MSLEDLLWVGHYNGHEEGIRQIYNYLKDYEFTSPYDIESLTENVAGVFEGTANFMQEVAIKQSDLDILRNKLKEIEADILKIKNYI
ncbi:unnamed protein product, partial [marine sediment metagenome]